MNDLDLSWAHADPADVDERLCREVEPHWVRLHFRVDSVLRQQPGGPVHQAWQGVSAAVRDVIDVGRRGLTPSRAQWAHRRAAELGDLLTHLDKEITTLIDGRGLVAGVTYAGDTRWVAAQDCRSFFERFISPALPAFATIASAENEDRAHQSASISGSRC